MQRCLIGMAALLALLLTAGTAVHAQTEWQIKDTIRFDDDPLDMVITHGNRKVYILGKGGEVKVFGFDGQLKGQFNVGQDVINIEPGPEEGMLFLLRQNDKSIQSIVVSLTEKIEVQGSPFKGPANAPVTIAVFSDFQ